MTYLLMVANVIHNATLRDITQAVATSFPLNVQT